MKVLNSLNASRSPELAPGSLIMASYGGAMAYAMVVVDDYGSMMVLMLEGPHAGTLQTPEYENSLFLNAASSEIRLSDKSQDWSKKTPEVSLPVCLANSKLYFVIQHQGDKMTVNIEDGSLLRAVPRTAHFVKSWTIHKNGEDLPLVVAPKVSAA